MNDTEYLMQKMTRAFEMREGRKFTALEKQFLTAAAHGATGLCHASCDVPRMEALLRERPALLESVGSAALSMAVSYFGTCEAVRFLLDSRRPRVLRLRDRALQEAPARAGDQGVLPRELRNPGRGIRGRRQQRLRHQHVARGMAGEHLAAVLGGRQAGRVHPVRARARRRPGSVVLGQRRARQHPAAGGRGAFRHRALELRRRRYGPRSPRARGALRHLLGMRNGRPWRPRGGTSRRSGCWRSTAPISTRRTGRGARRSTGPRTRAGSKRRRCSSSWGRTEG